MENIKSLIPADEDGFISIYNGSNSVIIFTLEYNFGGTCYLYRSPRFSLYFTQSLSIPSEAENIQLRVWYSVDVETWKILYSEEFSSPPENCYKIYEANCYPICAQIPCSELGSCNHVENSCNSDDISSSSLSIIDPCYCNPYSYQANILDSKETCYDDKYVCSSQEDEVYVCPQPTCKNKCKPRRNPFRLFR